MRAPVLEYTAAEFTNGHRFLDDLPKEELIEDAELEATATRAYDTRPAEAGPTGDS